MPNIKRSNLVVILLVIIVVISYLAYLSYLKRNPLPRNLDKDKDIIDKVESGVLNTPANNEYEGNKLDNGSSPFYCIYGGLYDDTNNTLRIINNSQNDVVVFLVELKNHEVLRNHYIQSNTSFTFKKIPNSTCYIKFYYGNDWNPNRLLNGVKTGGFEKNEQFIISNNEDDILTFNEYFEGNYTYYSEYTITLETSQIEGNILAEKRIKASEFF